MSRKVSNTRNKDKKQSKFVLRHSPKLVVGGLSLAVLTAGFAGSGTAFAQASKHKAVKVYSATSTSSSTSTTVTAQSLKWIVAYSAILQMDSVNGATVAQSAFDSPNTSIIVAGNPPSAEATWTSKFILDTKSASSLSTMMTATGWNTTTGVLYDPEHWSYTPLVEQLNVPGYVSSMSTTLFGTGHNLIVTPALDLMATLAPGQPYTQSFISLNIDGLAAKSADAIDIQAQSLETNTTTYANFVTNVANEIKAANPNAVIYAGLSTNPSGSSVTAWQLYKDVLATSGAVSGYWMNIPGQGSLCPTCGTPQPKVAVHLLSMLGA